MQKHAAGGCRFKRPQLSRLHFPTLPIIHFLCQPCTGPVLWTVTSCPVLAGTLSAVRFSVVTRNAHSRANGGLIRVGAHYSVINYRPRQDSNLRTLYLSNYAVLYQLSYGTIVQFQKIRGTGRIEHSTHYCITLATRYLLQLFLYRLL